MIQRCSRDNSDESIRIEGVKVGASLNLISMPYGFHPDWKTRSSSAPACVSQKYTALGCKICSACSKTKPSHEAPTLGFPSRLWPFGISRKLCNNPVSRKLIFGDLTCRLPKVSNLPWKIGVAIRYFKVAFIDSLILHQLVQICNPNADLYKEPSISNLRGKRIDAVLEKVIQMYYNILNKGAKKPCQ